MDEDIQIEDITLEDKIDSEWQEDNKSAQVTESELLSLRSKFEEEQKKREAAEKRAFEAETQRSKERQNTVAESAKRISAQETAVVNALAAHTSQIEAWTDQYASLMEEGKYKEAATLTGKIGAAQVEMSRLEQFKSQLSHEKVRTEDESKQDKTPTLSPQSQEWAKKHPEYFTNTKLHNKAVAAHYAALSDDIIPDTAEYFDFIDEFLGLNPKTVQAEDHTDKRKSNMSAPVSRSIPDGGRPTPGKIRLDRDEQEIAEACYPKLERSEAYRQYAKRKAELIRDGVINGRG